MVLCMRHNTIFLKTVLIQSKGEGSMFHTICMACIIIGILIPFCSIVLNLFDGFVDFISIDVLQLEFGQDMILDFLPFSINSLCLWSLIFGSLGLILVAGCQKRLS